MATKSRAEYFRERRNKFKTFSVEVEQSKMERLETYLKENDLSRREWFDRTLDEKLGKKE